MDESRLHALFDELPRQGVGSDAATQDALRRLRAHGLPDDPVVLDVGCGSGRQTMILGRVTGGRVTAVDIHPPFVGQTERRIGEAGLDRRMRAVRWSMAELDGLVGPESLDLLWAEGSAYVLGFAEALRRWRPLLRPGALVGISELTWLTASPPATARAFWAEAHPAMRTEAENRAAAEGAGYHVLESFTLPPSAWWDEYYRPLEARIVAFRDRHQDDDAWTRVLDAVQAEIDLFRSVGSSYGHVFYLLRRLG